MQGGGRKVGALSMNRLVDDGQWRHRPFGVFLRLWVTVHWGNNEDGKCVRVWNDARLPHRLELFSRQPAQYRCGSGGLDSIVPLIMRVARHLVCQELQFLEDANAQDVSDLVYEMGRSYSTTVEGDKACEEVRCGQRKEREAQIDS